MEGSRVAPRPAPTNPQHQGWDLQWRRSSRVATTKPISQVAAYSQSNDVFAAGNIPPDRNRLRVGNAANLSPIAQATWLAQQQESDPFALPPELAPSELAPSELAPSEPQSKERNYFNDPFGDDPVPAPTGEPAPAPDEALFPPPTDVADPVLPNETRPMNELRSEFDRLDQPMRVPDSLRGSAPRAQPVERDDTPPSAQPRATTPGDGPSLGEMLRDNNPDEGLNPQRSNETDNSIQTPDRNRAIDRSNQDQFDNPFPRQRGNSADELERDRMNSPPTRDDGVGRYEGERVKQYEGVSCDELRQRIAVQTIDDVSLDISPPYRPDEIDIERYEKLKADFDEKQVIRQWRSLDGRELATGRLRDLAYENAVIETEDGASEVLPVSRLSEADLAYIAQNWGLPNECHIEQVAYVPRNWTSMTMTWKASNLCHNPLYFEDVNLERYGHTHGPVLEPVVQSAHFFANIAVLPYKMGMHTPCECQYALGYYRPGNCAPWIIPPIPFSTRGAITQAATMTGLFWLIP
jgi:hypothetical protein